MVLDQEWPPLVEKKYLQEGAKKEEKNSQLSQFSSLKRRIDFLNVRKSGFKVNSKYFIVNYEFTKLNQIMLGLTVSKKMGNAVRRNYLRRLIRAIIKKNLNKLNKSMSFEIIPKKNILNANFIDLEKDLIKTLTNL